MLVIGFILKAIWVALFPAYPMNSLVGNILGFFIVCSIAEILDW